MTRLLIPLAVAAALLVFPGAALADSPFDPAHADEIAHRVLLQPSDLPGDGWNQHDVALDTSLVDVAVPDTEACSKSLGPMLDAAKKHPDGTIAGQAAEALSHGGGLLSIPTEVTLQVDVHEDDEYLGDAMARTRDMLAGPDLSTCLGDVFGKTLGGAFKPSVKDVQPGASAPNDGIARAVEISLGSGLVSVSVRMELYVWTYGNAVVQASVIGAGDNLNADLANAVVSGMQAKLDYEAGP